MSTSQLSLRDVTKRYGERGVLDRLSLTVKPGERDAVEVHVGGHHVTAPASTAAWSGGRYTFHRSESERLTSS
jgi:hypothetical protein